LTRRSGALWQGCSDGLPEEKHPSLQKMRRLAYFVDTPTSGGAEANFTVDELGDIFLDRLAYLRMSNWASCAERWNREANEHSLSGSEKEAESLYAKAATYTMAAETYRMLIQGD